MFSRFGLPGGESGPQGCDHDDWCNGGELLHLQKNLQPSFVREVNVQGDQIGRILVKARHSFGPGSGFDYLMASQLQFLPNRPSDQLLIVDDQDIG